MASDSSFKRPTRAQLIQRIKTDIETRLTGADANLRGSPEEVLAIAEAGLTHGLHGHLKWLSRQLLDDICDEEFLVRRAGMRGLERLPSQQAHGTAHITGVNASVCPAGTIWQRADGIQFSQDVDATISSSSATIDLTALLGGVDGNTAVATALSLTSSVTGIDSTATVNGDGIIDGSDIETVDALRSRYLADLRTPPSGGGPGDYIRWAKRVPGVTRAWEYPNMLGLGTVGLYFVRDGDDVTIIPDAGEISDVQDYIDSVRPVTAEVSVLALTAQPINFVFSSVTPDTTAVRDAIQAELEALISEEAEPELSIFISHIRESISIATGETNFTLTSPTTDQTAGAAAILTMGTITWP